MSDKIYKSYKFRLLPKEDQIPMLESILVAQDLYITIF